MLMLLTSTGKAAAFTLALASISAFAQSGQTIFFQPPTLIVGSGPTTLGLYIQNVNSNAVVRWNGASKPTSPGDTGSGSLSVALTADDLAAPSLAEVTVFDPNTGAKLADSWIPVGFNVVPLATVYDAVRNLFYIATGPGSTDPQFPPNSIVVVHPSTGAVGPSLSAGTTLGDMALSDDGKVLYVMLSTQSLVRRINPENLTVVGDFPYRPAGGSLGAFGEQAGIAVMPGKPETVAILYAPNPASTGMEIDIFDSGAKRPNVMSSANGLDTLLFSPDGQYLFEGGRTDQYPSTVTLRYTVDSSGIPKQTPLSALGGAPVAIVNGVLYTSHATVINAATMQVIANLGEGYSIAVDAANQRILTAWAQGDPGAQYYPEVLQAYDLKTALPLGTQPMGSVYYFLLAASPGVQLFRFGVDGILYSSRTNLLMFHTPLAGPAPAMQASDVVSGASFLPGPISPGEIVSIFGTNLGPQPGQAFSVDLTGKVVPPLGGVQVWFDRMPGTVLYASSGQINVIAPFELQPGSTVNLQVWNLGIPSPQVPRTVVAAVPALFTTDGSGKGRVVAINQDGSVNTPSPPGSVVALYGTGGGLTGASVDGFLAWNVDSLAGFSGMQVSIGGQNATVYYAGAAPTLVNGAVQINLTVPGNAASGSVLPIRIQIDGQSSLQEATIAIR
jgi:uncharacterized protein (TIGR03437 family)